MARKFRKATPAEIATYQATGPVYPLAYWVTVDGQTCPVEKLHNFGGNDPAYEIILPAGFHSLYDDTHTLLCDNLADVRDRAGGTVLTPCGSHCR